MKCVYISGTEQHAGKTTTALGIYAAARESGYDACYFKPVGQRSREVNGCRANEDALVFKHALDAEGDLDELNPLPIPHGFTRDYVFDPRTELTRGRIRDAFDRIRNKHELAVVEGTGHAGVGSVLDVSNARVAAMLNARCVMVSPGGIGRSVDLVALNRAVFERENVPICGAIINKVYEEKYEEVAPAVIRGLDNIGIRCLGVIPYRSRMTRPTVTQIQEELDLELLRPGRGGERDVVNVEIASDGEIPSRMDSDVTDWLLMLPGERPELVKRFLTDFGAGTGETQSLISAIVVSAGFRPDDGLLKGLQNECPPVLLSGENTLDLAVKLRGLTAKIWEKDINKIDLARRLVKEYVDTEKLFELVGVDD